MQSSTKSAATVSREISERNSLRALSAILVLTNLGIISIVNAYSLG